MWVDIFTSTTCNRSSSLLRCEPVHFAFTVIFLYHLSQFVSKLLNFTKKNRLSVLKEICMNVKLLPHSTHTHTHTHTHTRIYIYIYIYIYTGEFFLKLWKNSYEIRNPVIKLRQFCCFEYNYLSRSKYIKYNAYIYIYIYVCVCVCVCVCS